MRRNVYMRALVLVLVALAPCGLAIAQGSHVFLVSQNAVSRADHEDEWGDGTAFAAIQDAIDAAQADTAGFYLILVEISPLPYNGPIEIDAGANITLLGILDSVATPDRPTILGVLSGPVVSISGAGSGVTIDTFRIVGGDPGVEITGLDETQVAQPTITKCVIRGGADGVECFEHSRPRIVNCMIVDNADAGVVCWGDSQPSLMNDTISENTTGIDLLAGGLAIDITNTIAWGNSVDDVPAGLTAALTVVYSDIGSVAFGGTNMSADPLFVGGGSFEISALSPCVDAGTSVGAPVNDYEWEARGFDGTGVPGDRGDSSDFDIGADEYEPVLAPPTPPTAFAIPDPTSYQPEGGLLFFVTGESIEGVQAVGPGPVIETFDIVPGSVYANRTPIPPDEWESAAWDGTWNIEVMTSGSWQQAGTFLIDTTPPIVGPEGGVNGPYNILADHNDYINTRLLNEAANMTGHWAVRGLPNPSVPATDTVLNDGVNFFFNTGARLVNGVIAGGPLWGVPGPALLEIDFEVEATDPGAEPSGFEGYWARSGRPIIRDQNQLNTALYLDPVPIVPGPGVSVTWQMPFRPLSEGVYEIDIVAEDRAGNVGVPVPLRVYWDKTPPSTNITSRPRSRESSTLAAFTWRQSGTQFWPRYSTVLQRFIPEPWNVFVPPPPIENFPGFTPFYETQGTTYGPPQIIANTRYRFTVLGVDDAGNIETTVGTNNQYEWTVGDPVPNTVITSGPPRITTDTSAVFIFREIPEDNNVEFQWRLLSPTGTTNWITAQPNERAQRTVSFFDEFGDANRAVSYVFQVRAWKDYNGDNVVDPVAEADPTPATYAWTVVPPARGDDPGGPVLPPDTPTEEEILRSYGIGQYVDAPGEQPVKYFREQAK